MFNLFPDDRTFLSINVGGSLDIKWYAVLILTGALATYLISRNEFKKAKFTDLDFFESLFVYTLFAGIIGARLWFCAFYDFDYYLAHPSAIIRVWDGGLAIQGGLIFGALFAYYYSKKNGYQFIKILDILLPNVLVAQAFGRWGNFINQECHGPEVSEAYFNGVLAFLKKGMFINGAYYEPLFFYESVLCIIGWVIIYFVLRPRQRKKGDLAYAYLMWYGAIRFFIEWRRTDSLMLGNIKMAQLTSVLFIIVGVLGFVGILRKHTTEGKPTIIFDFDGTLVDTSESIVEAYRECFKKYSNSALFTKKVKNEIIGPALKDLFPKYFPNYDYDTVYQTYRAKQLEVAATANHPTLNSVECLRKLHEQGYKIGIVSTRTKSGIEEILKSFEMDKYIDDICGLKEVKNLKPDPEGINYLIEKNNWNKDVVYVGDTMMDMECGRNYGAYNIVFIQKGSRKKKILELADKYINDYNQLLEIMSADINFDEAKSKKA